MSDRIIQGFSEMKDIYLSKILTEEKEEDYGEKYEGRFKKTGKKSKDYDGDGEVEDESDEYAGVKDRAIRNAKGEDEDEEKSPRKKRSKKEKEDKDDMQTESFSNWRTDLYEVISKLEPKVKDIDNAPIKEKPVNNKIILNPNVTEGIEILGEQELTEEFLEETASVAAEYFVSHGLNEHGLELVIDYLGEDKFLEYVFCITEDALLTEARRSGRIEPVTKTGKQIGSLKGGAKTSSIKAKRKEKAARREAEETSQAAKPSGLTSALKSQSEVAKKVTADRGNRAIKVAASEQPKTKAKASETKNKIAAGILDLIAGAQKQYQRGMERHRVATGLATQTAQTGAKLAGTIAKGAKEFGGGMVSGARTVAGLETLKGKDTKLGRNVAAASIKGARTATRAVRDSAARQVGKNRAKVAESVQYIMEKAVSEQQQKIFGLALAVKRGEVSRSKVSEKVLEIADGMSEGEIRKFASTKHKGIPNRK